MSDQRNFIGNWIKLNPDIQPHQTGYEDVLKSPNASALGAFKLAPVLPPMSVPSSELRSRVLTSQRVRNAVELLTASLNQPANDIAAIAGSEYDSMAANLEPLAVRSLFFLAAPVVKRLFSHIFVNRPALEKLRTAMLKHPVVLLPTHRSYMDFILLDIALYICDMPLPTIAAATDFSSMRVFGEWLRRCGAFFVQRGTGNAGNLVTTSISNGSGAQEEGGGESRITRPLLVVDDAAKAKDWKFISADYLHRALLAEYIHQLVVYGHHRFLEFFIEGKRSRTGKACSPKRGLLNSIAEAFLHGDVDDIYLCPVSICFDKFLEESLYAREMLGTPKPKESTSGLFKSGKILFSNNYGSVVFTFGNLISLREKSQGRIDRHLHALHPAWIGAMTVGERDFLTEVAVHVVDMHHQLTSLPLFSLVAACMTSAVLLHEMAAALSPNCHLSQIVEQVRWLVSLLTAAHSSAFLSVSHSLDSTIHQVLRLHSNILSLNRKDGSLTICSSPDDDDMLLETMVQLCMYRNQSMFAFFPLAALSLAVVSSEQSQLVLTTGQLFCRYSFLAKLLRMEFVSTENLKNESLPSFRQNFESTLLFMIDKKMLFRQGERAFDAKRSATCPETMFLAALLQPFVFGYSLCCSFLLLRASAPSAFLQNPSHYALLERLDASPNCTILSQVLALAKNGSLPASSAWSVSSDLIGNALASFADLGLIVKSLSKSKMYTVKYQDLELLQEKIASFLPPRYPSSAKALSSAVFFNVDSGASHITASSSYNNTKPRSTTHSKL